MFAYIVYMISTIMYLHYYYYLIFIYLYLANTFSDAI